MRSNKGEIELVQGLLARMPVGMSIYEDQDLFAFEQVFLMWLDQERSNVNRILRYLKVGVVSIGHPLIEMGEIGCVLHFLRETSINLHFE